MFRCFDCNFAAVTSGSDTAPLVEDGSWQGPHPSKSADSQPPVTSEKRSVLSTEYKMKFRPFSDYSYVDGHFTGGGSGAAAAAADSVDSAAPAAAQERATPWYEEVVELRRKANSYKKRGWGKETAYPHLAHLYDKEDDPRALAERKIISALYLETMRGAALREERGRSPTATGGASIRQQSHPPPISRKSPGAAKMSLRLHSADTNRRPHSAQPASARPAGDAVDSKAKGRSPATPRTPNSRPASSSSPAEQKPLKTRKKSADKPAKAPLSSAPAAQQSTAEPSGKGIRGGTPRSRSASKLAGDKAKPAAAAAAAAEQKAEGEPAAPTPAMTSSAPAVDTPATAGVSPQPPSADKLHEDMVKSAPEPTRVKSPEESTAINSPEPVNWTVPLDTNRTFTVTQNVVSGHGSPLSSRGDSVRSPADDQTRSPRKRATTELSHLREELGVPPPPPPQQPEPEPEQPATNGDSRTPAEHDTDLMSTSMMGESMMSASMTPDQLSGSLHDGVSPGHQEAPQMSLLADDPMTRSFHGEVARPEKPPPPPPPAYSGQTRVLDDPLLSDLSAAGGDPASPRLGDHPPGVGWFSSGSAEAVPRFSGQSLFGRPTEASKDASQEKPMYRVI